MAIEDPIAAAESLIAAGRAGEAARDLRMRLASGRGGALARITLVRALLAADDVKGALAEAREATALNPDVAPVLVALGEALLAAEALPAAIAELQRALRRDPGNLAARRSIAAAWLKAGEADKALEILHAFEPASDIESMIAAAEAMRMAPRSDPGYVRHLFDQFSADYDSCMLGQLHYAGPQILAELASLMLMGRSNLSILDLGCGTGLAGAAFKHLAARLDGIDLSPAMIEQARHKGIYDSLTVADLETYLAAEGPRYDLILAADTLVYLGELGGLFQTAARRLRPEGYFLFTLEAKPGKSKRGEAKPGGGFELGTKRRWRHSENYLRETAAASGLMVAGFVTATPRTEANQPVEGFAVALTTPG